jgi:hypothetical protein
MVISCLFPRQLRESVLLRVWRGEDVAPGLPLDNPLKRQSTVNPERIIYA